MKNNYFYIVFIIALCICTLCGCGNSGKQEEQKVSPVANEEDTEIVEQVNSEKVEPTNKTENPDISLEAFGSYLQDMIMNNKRIDLNQYIISKQLTWAEAAEISGRSPAFTHFEEYGKYNFNSYGAIIVEGDVNQDGILDVIEYLPFVDINDSLTIYIGREDGSYGVMYFEPYFASHEMHYDYISVVSYQDRTYLLFENTLPSKAKNRFYTIILDAYQITEENLSSRIRLEYEYNDIVPEVVACKEEFEAESESLSENAMNIFLGLQEGSAEERVPNGDEKYTELDQYAKQSFKANWNKYQPLAGDTPIVGLGTSAYDKTYQGDLDNDGDAEIYAKETNLLGIGLSKNNGHIYFNILKTGEEKFDRVYGLGYTMLKDGKGTDIEEISGLDIWDTELIPQYFWVDSHEEGNIVCIYYVDEELYEGKVEGYIFRDGGYEKVLTVKYTPVIKCKIEYEQKEENGNTEPLKYTIHLKSQQASHYLQTHALEEEEVLKNIMNGEETFQTMQIYGINQEEMQNKINNGIENYLYMQLDKFRSLNENVVYTIWETNCKITAATENEIIIQYTISYFYNEDHNISNKSFYLKINIDNGEMVEIEEVPDNNEVYW